MKSHFGRGRLGFDGLHGLIDRGFTQFQTAGANTEFLVEKNEKAKERHRNLFEHAEAYFALL